MKRLILTICLAVFFVAGCGSSRYITLGGGSNVITAEYATVTKTEGRDNLSGGGLSYLYGQEKPDGTELGGFAKYGIEIIENKRLFATILGGLSFAQEDYSHTAQGGKEVYANSTIHGLFGGGIVYFINNDKFCIQIDYDNRRKLTAGFGFRF